MGFFAAFIHNFSPFCSSTWVFVLCYLLNLPSSFTAIPWKLINIHTHFRVAPNHKKTKMSCSNLPGFLWFIGNFPVSQNYGSAHNNHEHLSHTKFASQNRSRFGIPHEFLLDSSLVKSCSIFVRYPKPPVIITIFVSMLRKSLQMSEDIYTRLIKI